MVDRAASFLGRLLLRFDPRSAEVCLGITALLYGASELAGGDLRSSSASGSAMLLGILTQLAAYGGKPATRRVVNVLNAAFWSAVSTSLVDSGSVQIAGISAGLAITASLVAVRAHHV